MKALIIFGNDLSIFTILIPDWQDGFSIGPFDFKPFECGWEAWNLKGFVSSVTIQTDINVIDEYLKECSI